MAQQARDAIAINESRGLPVPDRWREWAAIDNDALAPHDTS